MTIAPEMLLPPSAMPWGRSVEDRIAETDARIAYQLSADSGDAASTRAAADSISERLGELEKVMGISRYDLAPFSIPYSGVPIGGDPILIFTPTWNINVASTVETISAIIKLKMSDSTGTSLGPRAGRMLFRAGRDSTISQGQYSTEVSPLPRTLMLTTPAQHPFQVSAGFQSSAISGGTLTGYGELTLVFYGR